MTGWRDRFFWLAGWLDLSDIFNFFRPFFIDVENKFLIKFELFHPLLLDLGTEIIIIGIINFVHNRDFIAVTGNCNDVTTSGKTDRFGIDIT